MIWTACEGIPQSDPAGGAGGNAGSPGANAVGVSEGGLVMTPGLGGTAGTVSGPGQGGEGGSVTTDPCSGAITNGDAWGEQRRGGRSGRRSGRDQLTGPLAVTGCSGGCSRIGGLFGWGLKWRLGRCPQDSR